MTLRAKDIPVNEVTCALKIKQKIITKQTWVNQKTCYHWQVWNERDWCQGFLSHHSKYKYRVPTPSWMLHVCIIYSIRDYRFNSLVTAWECGVRFGQTSYIENQNRKIPFQITLDTQKKNSPLSWNPLGIKRIEPLSGCCFARSFAYPLIWLNQDQRKSRE